MRTFSSLLLICALAGASFFVSCGSSRTIPPNTIVISGKMNAVSGGKVLGNASTTCWAMESGRDIRMLEYYQFIGSEDLLKKLYEEDAMVTVRVILRPDVKTECPVGTVAEVFEIMDIKSKKD